MILIVEGSNKVGKTTFIHALANILEADGFIVELQNKRPAKNNKYEVTKEKMYEVTRDDFINALRKSLDNVKCKHVYIFDRSYISEYVYGKKYRGYENDEVLKLDKFISEIPFVEQILLCSTYTHIEDNAKVLEYMDIQYKMMTQIMKCESMFSVQFIEDENAAGNLAVAYAKRIEAKMK